MLLLIRQAYLQLVSCAPERRRPLVILFPRLRCRANSALVAAREALVPVSLCTMPVLCSIRLARQLKCYFVRTCLLLSPPVERSHALLSPIVVRLFFCRGLLLVFLSLRGLPGRCSSCSLAGPHFWWRRSQSVAALSEPLSASETEAQHWVSPAGPTSSVPPALVLHSVEGENFRVFRHFSATAFRAPVDTASANTTLSSIPLADLADELPGHHKALILVSTSGQEMPILGSCLTVIHAASRRARRRRCFRRGSAVQLCRTGRYKRHGVLSVSEGSA